MHKTIFITFICFLETANTNEIRYEKIFPEEFNQAICFLATHSSKIKTSASQYKNNPELVSTVVFPELMRYSTIKDVLETSALELLYVEKGVEGADFSIGCFQMKPSFAEEIEKNITNDEALNLLYSSLAFNNKLTEKEKRKQRLNRLQNINWQLTYLNAFFSISRQRFCEEKYANTNDSIAFYASAYNTGFTKSSEIIRSNTKQNYFPYGVHYKGKQYSYSDVACYFNKYVFQKKKNSQTLK